jgi:radical SAM protein with 4Fe4S-binding SPASM domain
MSSSASVPSAEKRGAAGKEKTVVESVQRWLGNPASKAMLRFICGRSKLGGNRLDIAIRRYVGEDVPCDFRDRLASLGVKFIIDRGLGIFSYSGEELKKNLSDPTIRRGMVNVLEGIARYGTCRPFTSVAPFLVVWNYTKFCNLKCEHCYEGAGPKPADDELTTEEAKRVVDQFEDAGVVAIAFSGGEPLLRKDIFEVARYAKSKGFFISVATNGTVITRKLAKEIKKVFDYVEISLDGFAKVHDRFRGVPGAWKRTCEGIKNCVAEDVDTCVALTATRYNVHEIPKLVDFVEGKLGVKRVIVFNYVPVGRGTAIIDQDLSPQQRQELLKYLYSRMVCSDGRLLCYTTAPQYSMVSWEFAYGKGDTTGLVSTHFTSEGAMKALQGRTKSLADFLGGCGAGRLYCGLEPNGDVTPCVFIPIKLGNIRKDKLRDIWHSSDLLWKLRIREDLKGCGKCEYRYICGGCRARAYGYYGDVQAPDPGCIYNLKYWQELKNAEGKKQRLPAKLKAA